MAEPRATAQPSDPSVAPTICATSDAGSGYVTPPSTTGREGIAATAAESAHCNSRRDGTASGGGGCDSSSENRTQGSNQQRSPSDSTEKDGSKAAEAADVAPPTETGKGRKGSGGASGAWQWVNNAGKRASGKFSRATRGTGGGDRRPSPTHAQDDSHRAGELTPAMGKGNNIISDFVGREPVQSKAPIDRRSKAFTTPISETDQRASSDCSSSEELAKVDRSEMLASVTAARAAGSGNGDGIRARRPARRKARYRRKSSSGSSREPRLVASPRSAASSDGDRIGGISCRGTTKDDALVGAETRRQALNADGEGSRNGGFHDFTGERDLKPAHGKSVTPTTAAASGVAAAWSWKTLALAKTSTASTSATSVNSAALGPSSPPQSEVNATGRAGNGDGGVGGSGSSERTAVAEAAKAGPSASSPSSPLAPALAPSPAPAPATRLEARVRVGRTAAGSRARDSSGRAMAAPIASVASGAGVKATNPDMKVPSENENGLNAVASAATAAASHVVGTSFSRPPPVPTSSVTASRAKTPKQGGAGEHAGKCGRASGRRYPIVTPSPDGSAYGPRASATSGGEGGGGGGEGRKGRERSQQLEAMPTASRATAIADGGTDKSATLQVDVEGGSTAGGFNYLDSAGGGSFEIEAFDKGKTATVPTPITNNATIDNTEGMDEDDGGSDSFDSGFESVASPGESIGNMTEGEMVAAAEAAMNSAKKATAGAVPGAHTPRSQFLLSTIAAPSFHPAEAEPATIGVKKTGTEVGVGPAGSDSETTRSAAASGVTRNRMGEKSSTSVEQGGSGSSTRRTIRDDSWWREGAAKALAASADNKKTPSRSRSSTPGRGRGGGARSGGGVTATAAARPATGAGGMATSRGPKGTPSTRGGSRRGDRAGGGGGPGAPEDGEGGGAGASSSSAGGYLSPSRAAADAEVSPTFSTISSREQAERDRERLATVDGTRGYRRSSWGVALPSNGKGNTNSDGNTGVTGTSAGYGTDEGYFNNAGAKSSRRGSRASYHSLDSSGWGLTSDEGGDGESQDRRWRPSLTSSVRSAGGGDGSVTASSGAGPTSSSSAYGSSVGVDTSVFSDDEGSSSSRSSISTGYESSTKGEERGAADRAEEWAGGREGDELPPSPPGNDAPPKDGDGVSLGPDNYPPPSPAGSPQTPASTQHQVSSLSKLEISALKKKAHYEKQANAAAGAARAAAALAAAAGANAAANKQSSHSFGDRSQGGSASSIAGRSNTVVSGVRERRRGRMPSETRAILSRGGSLPAFDVFDPRSTSGGRSHARHVSGGDSGGGGESGEPVGSLSSWPRGQTGSNQPPLSRRVQSTVSESARPRHASVEEAIAMAVAWTPSQLQRGGDGGGGGGGADDSLYSQSQQEGRATKEERGGSAGQRRGERGGGAAGDRASGSAGRGRDSQYFFSSRGSSVRGMSPAGIVQDHQQRHRNPSPAKLRHANSRSSTKHEGNSTRQSRDGTNNNNNNADDSWNGRSREGSRGQRRSSRKPLPTPPTPEDRQNQQQEQQRRRRAKRLEAASSGGQEQRRAPLEIPPLPKVLFRPPLGTPRQGNPNQPRQQQQQEQKQQQQQQQHRRRQQQQKQPSSTRNEIMLADAAGGGSSWRGEGGGGGGGGRGGYFRGSPPPSAGDYWPPFAGTPTSTSFSPSSAVANPFIATRYTQRSSLSTRSNSTSQRGDGGSGPIRSGASEARVSPSSPIGGIRARALPRAVHNGSPEDDEGRRRGRGRGRGSGNHASVTASSPPRDGRKGGASSSHRRTSSNRSSRRNNQGGGTAAAAVDSGSVSDLGGDVGARNPGGSSRPIFRTMSLRGRSLFSGGTGFTERRSVSMSSFGGPGDSMRADGDYDRSQSWRGGGRRVANRVCSVLSVGWLFSRKNGKAKGKSKKRRKGKNGGPHGGPLGGALDASRTSSRRSAYSGAGAVGVMGNGHDDDTSSDEDDGDDVFEIGGPRDIAVGGGGSRQSGSYARGGGAGDRAGFTKGGGKTNSEGGGRETGAAPAIGVNDEGRNRLSFTRSGLLGLDRSSHSAMSSYSFVQHAPSRGGGSAKASNGAARMNAAQPSPGAEKGGIRNSTDPSSANLTINGSGGATKANGNASEAPAASMGSEGVQYVNFNGHGGRGGGVVALRGAGVAAVEIQGETPVAGAGFSSMIEPGRRPEVDEEEAKRRMDALLLRSRVHTHLNPTGAPGAGTAAY